MAKWDIKDEFWRMDCREGEEWNFAYVLPQPEGEPIRLVIPTSLQMGWVESPPYFCAATETARDIATTYIETGIGTLPNHKFEQYTSGAEAFDTLPAVADINNGFNYALEVYVDDFISIVIPASQEQLRHESNAIMEGIHDIFPPDDDDANDPISEKKLLKRAVNLIFSRHFWVSNSMVLGKHYGWRKQRGKRSSLLFILGPGWHRAGMGAYRSNNLTTCLHGNPSRRGLTVSVQPHPG